MEPRPETVREAGRLLDRVWNGNRLIVSHEGGHHRTVVKIEVDPAGNLVVWLED